jgi:hypothetical protein
MRKGQVRGWSSPEDRVPTGPERTDIEVAQARNLDVECLAVWLSRTDLGARHVGLGRAALGCSTTTELVFMSARDPIGPLAVDLL